MRSIIDWHGCSQPLKQILDGRYVRLEPLDREKHTADLFNASQQGFADLRFAYLPESAPADLNAFSDWMDKSLNNPDFLFYAAIDKRTNRAEGRAALMRMDVNNGVIEVGSIMWGDAIKRSRITTEAIFLMADYVFSLGFRRLEWKCNNDNEPSKKAALRFGFQYEGLFRQHMFLKGKNRDSAWFSILDKEWPNLREKYLVWLDPNNFDDTGLQKSTLNLMDKTTTQDK